MFPEQTVTAAHGFMTRSGRRSGFILYVKIRPCKLFSRLPEIFEGKSRREIQGKGYRVARAASGLLPPALKK
jgi:hypothetical protein